MSYAKKYDVGSIRLDAPYTHFIYELPLLSFGDINHTIGLSLVYQSKLTDNPFHIKNGLKLNLQKRLVLQNGTFVQSYENGDGSLVGLNNYVDYFTFNDESQRIIRWINGTFVLENPDFSTEIYNSSGNIISVRDKYGEEYLSYTYSEGKLSSIKYRDNKFINLSYNEDRLNYIEYSCENTIARSCLVYSGSTLKIQHYSGVDYHLTFEENQFMVCSTDRDYIYSNTYSHRLTNTIENSVDTWGTEKRLMTISQTIGTKEVDRIKYDFLGIFDTNKFRAVNITDFNDVVIRLQYENDKPCYAYEVMDIDDTSYENIFLEDSNGNKIYKGTVHVNKDDIVGTEGPNDRLKMTYLDANTNNWSYLLTGGQNLYGNFRISGWIEVDSIEECTFSVSYRSGSRESVCNHTISNLIPGIWNYFTFSCYMENPDQIYVSSNYYTNVMVTRDFRLSFEEGKIYEPTEINHFTTIKDVFIKEGENASNEIILACDDELYFYNGSTQLNDVITAKDVLKYKINQKYGTHKNEIYYDNCKGIITNSGTFKIGYKVGESDEITKINIDDIAVGKRYIRNEKTYITKSNFYLDANGNENFASKSFINNEEISSAIYDNHLDLLSSTNDGVTTSYLRSNGLLTYESVADLYTNNISYSEDDNRNPKITMRDEFNNVTEYTLDSIWGTVKTIRLPDGTTISDEYDDDMCARIQRTIGDNEASISYTYSNGNLSGLQSSNLFYNFGFSGGDLVSIAKCGETIEEHEHSKTGITSYYPTKSNKIYDRIINYNNYGEFVSLQGEIVNAYNISPDFNSDGTLISMPDNASSLLAMSTDVTTGEVSRYEYDSNNLLTKKTVTGTSFSNKISEETFTYDALKRIKTDSCAYDVTNSKSISKNITYVKSESDPTADNRVSTYTYKVNGEQKARSQNYYDVFKRLATKSTSISPQNDLYFTRNISYNYSKVSQISDSFSNSNKGTDTYNYDAMGRIASHIYSSDNTGNYKTYVYDSLGRLVRECDAALDKTFVYCYDNIGNITSVRTYDYTTEETPSGSYTSKSFSYNGAVKDRLTSCSYGNISYDSNGYPISIENRKFVWTKGRLTRIYDDIDINSSDSSEDIRFTYNAYGQRTGKIYSYNPGSDYSGDFLIGSTTTYNYDSSGRLIREFCREEFSESASMTKELFYLYDEAGIIGVTYTYNGTTKSFYYRKNLQGDVVAIYDHSGARKAEYAYDAFGNGRIVYSASDTDIASTNPIRYRGYYYDSETGLYLNARYYNPEWRRFISPDSTEYIDAENPNGLNLYTYCYNDPVNYKQRPVSSGGSITDSTFSGTLGVGFVPIVGVTGVSSGIFNQTLKGSFRNGLLFGSGSITSLYADWNARAQISLRKGTVKVGIAGKFSVFNVSGQIGFGTEDLNLSLKAVGDALTVSGMAGIFIDPKKNTYFIGAEAKATALSGRVGGQLDIFGLQIEVGLSGELGSIGGRVGIGLKPTEDGKMQFYYGSGFALGVGWDFYIRIRFDELF